MDILAKSSKDGNPETLEDHTRECIRVATRVLDNLPDGVADERLRRKLLVALVFHDTGKAATGFQEVLRDKSGKRRTWNHWRHEILSASFASLYGQPEEVVFAVLTHHRQIPPIPGLPTSVKALNPDEIPFDGAELTPVWLRMKDEWERNQHDFSPVWSKIAAEVGIKEIEGGYSLPCLGIARNWLDSGKHGQRQISLERRMLASKLRGLLITSDHLASAHKMPPNAILLREFSIGINARAFQRKTASCEGSLVLRAPTGSGKTEAALLWAQSNQARNARLFYVLPNIASINAMQSRLSGIFGSGNVGLLHSRATAALYHLMENKDEMPKLEKQAEARLYSQLARELYYPVRVSTPHQILRNTLRGKGWETMLSDMPTACFIFDEVHAYEPRIVGLVLGSVRLLTSWGAKACFMSATLPSFLRELIERVTQTTFIEPDKREITDREVMEKKRHRLEVMEGTIVDHMLEIENAAAKSNSTLIVCNTVVAAQDVYRRISCPDKLLLHSRFNQDDRLRIEGRLSGSNLPRVVVATQAIEVSLNVDFETAFIEPAPIDALIQRMGRVNRFGKQQSPAKVTILGKELSKHSVYTNRDRVNEGIEALKSSREPITEEDLVAAADVVYRSGYTGDEMREFEQGLNHPDLVDLEHTLVAGASEDWIEETIERADRSVDLLPHTLQGRYEKLSSDGLWIEANNLLVPVNVQSVAGLLRTEKVDTLSEPWTVSCHYTSDLGLTLEPDIQSAII